MPKVIVACPVKITVWILVMPGDRMVTVDIFSSSMTRKVLCLFPENKIHKIQYNRVKSLQLAHC